MTVASSSNWSGCYTFANFESGMNMARTFRLALAQLNLTVGDLSGNTSRMVEYLRRARECGADLVAFPELATTGYPPEDLLFKKSFIDGNLLAMEDVIAESRGIAVVLGYVRPLNPGNIGEGVTNAAAIGYDGRLVDSYDKIFLPNYGVFDEERYFKKGNVCPVYDIGGVRVGVNVCEDIWYAVGPCSVQRQAGAELIVNINASPFHAGKSAYRRDSIVGSRAADHGMFVAYLNTVGGQDELVFDGNSMVCDPLGRVVTRGPAFQEALVLADIDSDSVPVLPAAGSGEEYEASLAAVGTAKVVQIPLTVNCETASGGTGNRPPLESNGKWVRGRGD